MEIFFKSFGGHFKTGLLFFLGWGGGSVLRHRFGSIDVVVVFQLQTTCI